MPKNGFTLVEILVAIAIISIISVIAIPNFRRFSEETVLKNEVSTLVQVLKKAQSNAQASLNCADGKASRKWSVDLSAAGSHQYSLKSTCIDATGGPDVSLEEKRIQVTSFITLSILCDQGASFKEIYFQGSTVTDRCNITLINTQSNIPARSVTVEKGGVIKEE